MNNLNSHPFNDSRTSGVCYDPLSLGKKRVYFASDNRLSSIAAKWKDEMSLWEKIKSFIGCVSLKDGFGAGKVRRLSINIRSFAKRLGISVGEARKILNQVGTVQDLSNIVADIIGSLGQSTNATADNATADNVQNLASKVFSLIAKGLTLPTSAKSNN